jgi:sulfate/thiosulfate transport system ATP-binding protein
MSIVLDGLSKRFGGHLVVDRVSLDVADGELFVLLGTSGSGKSTILRLIAGLVQPDQGKVLLHGRDVTALPPQERGTGFVFQNYSIFRHMNVADNIEFGLKIRNMSSDARAQRREELLEVVGMAGLGGRYSDQLSGGQQQRVALARALAYEPNVLLLDEPFGALDVKTRTQLRRSLKEVQRKLNVTAILVTHDQDEAFEIGDRIGVLDRGKLLEVGDAEELYSRPRTLFAATFLGAGTVLVGRVERSQARLGHLMLPIPENVPYEDGARVQALFRPEHVILSEGEPPDKSRVLGRGAVIDQNFSGALRRLRLRVPRLPNTRQISSAVPFGEEGMFVDAVLDAETPVSTRDLWVGVRKWHILQQPEPRFLVCEDAAPFPATLSAAKVMAEQMDASVTLLSVVGDSDKVDPQRAALHQRQQESGLFNAELRVRVGQAAEQICLQQNEALYSVVLLGQSRLKKSGAAAPVPDPDPGQLRRRRPGPTTMKILALSPSPVLVVKTPRPQFKRMVICTAVGEPGKNDVRIGGRLARRLGASVTLLYVSIGGGDLAPLVKAHLDRGAATVRALDVPVEICVHPAASPARGILDASRDGDYDLIVIGNHGPQSSSIFSRDDVMLQVLSGADRPVLVVPSEEI